MTHKQQELLQNKKIISIFKVVFTTLVLLSSLYFGFSHFIKKYSSSECTEKKLHTIQLLISSDSGTRNWNNITLNEGESVVSILDRVNKANDIGLIVTGEKKSRTIQTLLTKESNNGEWKYYINAASPLPSIDNYYPKAGDVISIVYNSK